MSTPLALASYPPSLLLPKVSAPFLSPHDSFFLFFFWCQRQRSLRRRMFTVAAEMDGDNWDLSAVVRSCRPSWSAAARDAVWAFPPLPEPLRAVEEGKGGVSVCLSQAFRNQSGLLELQEISRSSFPKVHSLPEQETVSWSPRSAAVLGSNLLPLRREVDRMSSQTPRSRRRKNQRQKKVVCHVAADDLSSDICAWRKYGQKPIKGSPYPRGYYRCSSWKGCPARKQVERSRADSAILTITYTGEHNHPIPTNCNSLAGSTCFEFPRSPTGEHNLEASHLSFATTAPELSPTTPLSVSILSRPGKEEGIVDEAEFEEEEDDTEGALLVKDMEIINDDDLLFLGATAPTVADITRILDGDGDGDSGDHLFPLL